MAPNFKDSLTYESYSDDVDLEADSAASSKVSRSSTQHRLPLLTR